MENLINNLSVSLQEKDATLTALRKFAEEYKEMVTILVDLPRKLSHDIMVPFGKGAFFKGHIQNTNQVIMHLGDAYFAERTVGNSLKTIRERLRETELNIKTQEDMVEKIIDKIELVKSKNVADPQLRKKAEEAAEYARGLFSKDHVLKKKKTDAASSNVVGGVMEREVKRDQQRVNSDSRGDVEMGEDKDDELVELLEEEDAEGNFIKTVHGNLQVSSVKEPEEIDEPVLTTGDPFYNFSSSLEELMRQEELEEEMLREQEEEEEEAMEREAEAMMNKKANENIPVSQKLASQTIETSFPDDGKEGSNAPVPSVPLEDIFARKRAVPAELLNSNGVFKSGPGAMGFKSVTEKPLSTMPCQPLNKKNDDIPFAQPLHETLLGNPSSCSAAKVKKVSTYDKNSLSDSKVVDDPKEKITKKFLLKDYEEILTKNGDTRRNVISDISSTEPLIQEVESTIIQEVDCSPIVIQPTSSQDSTMMHRIPESDTLNAGSSGGSASRTLESPILQPTSSQDSQPQIIVNPDTGKRMSRFKVERIEKHGNVVPGVTIPGRSGTMGGFSSGKMREFSSSGVREKPMGSGFTSGSIQERFVVDKIESSKSGLISERRNSGFLSERSNSEILSERSNSGILSDRKPSLPHSKKSVTWAEKIDSTVIIEDGVSTAKKY